MSEQTDQLRGYEDTIRVLTSENLILRDSLLRMLEGAPVGKRALDVIKKDQIELRKRTLEYLEERFRARRDAEKLGLVLLADPTEELEPQLGFDPRDTRA